MELDEWDKRVKEENKYITDDIDGRINKKTDRAKEY